MIDAKNSITIHRHYFFDGIRLGIRFRAVEFGGPASCQDDDEYD